MGPCSARKWMLTMKCLWWGTQSCFSVPVGKLVVPTKDKYTFLQWSNSISVYFRREISVHAHQKTWTTIFVAALLKIVKKWKQLRHLWVAEQINNLCCSHTVRRYSSEKGQILLYVPHECFTRTQQCWGEGSQIQKKTHRLLLDEFLVLFIWRQHTDQWGQRSE